MRVCGLVNKGGIGFRSNIQMTKTPELRFRAVLGNNGDRGVRLEWGQGKRLVEGALSETNPYAVRTSPRDSQSLTTP